MLISDILLHGQENAQPMRHLVNVTGENPRSIRKMIEAERRNGVLILSDNSRGYFLADNPAEVQQFLRSMRSRSKEILKTALAVEQAAGLGKIVS